MSDSDYLHIKLLLIGDYDVGKVSLRIRFVEDEWHLYGYARCEFGTKTIEFNQKMVKLQIWDPNGQERFGCVTRTYFRAAMGVMLVFDVTDSKSFDSLSFWLEETKKKASPDVSIVVVGNKIDLQSQRVVDRSTAERFCQERSIPYFETSAATGEGVNDAFLQLISATRTLAKIQMQSNINTTADAEKQHQTCTIC